MLDESLWQVTYSGTGTTSQLNGNRLVQFNFQIMHVILIDPSCLSLYNIL